MDRCPQCRARYKGGETCRRCGADVSLLVAIEARAETLARQAVAKLLADDIPAASKKALSCRRLHDTSFSRALAGFITHLNIKR